ncbi:hypothetical protein SCHPADRAFT_118647 [Schizopora paradoxa]|uniref:Uncharacterized protein n=1 Tax=Schizopora paradoxa TaxID=27342 RepID=A0A0H2S392_9AGAM|nr:hypothetical protein SCHPADRAFT_118647 [Schizopora paradoxa]
MLTPASSFNTHIPTLVVVLAQKNLTWGWFSSAFLARRSILQVLIETMFLSVGVLECCHQQGESKHFSFVEILHLLSFFLLETHSRIWKLTCTLTAPDDSASRKKSALISTHARSPDVFVAGFDGDRVVEGLEGVGLECKRDLRQCCDVLVKSASLLFHLITAVLRPFVP